MTGMGYLLLMTVVALEWMVKPGIFDRLQEIPEGIKTNKDLFIYSEGDNMEIVSFDSF